MIAMRLQPRLANSATLLGPRDVISIDVFKVPDLSRAGCRLTRPDDQLALGGPIRASRKDSAGAWNVTSPPG